MVMLPSVVVVMRGLVSVVMVGVGARRERPRRQPAARPWRRKASNGAWSKSEPLYVAGQGALPEPVQTPFWLRLLDPAPARFPGESLIRSRFFRLPRPPPARTALQSRLCTR